MSSHTQRQLRHEAEILNRFAGAYQEKFATLIRELNHAPAAANPEQCLRLCVETIHMLLATQSHLADALARLDEPAVA
jgi:hypothetical protein